MGARLCLRLGALPTAHLLPPIPCRPRAPGAIEGLKSLKQARITDPATGQSYGVVRLYADPGEPAHAHAAPAAAQPRPAPHPKPAPAPKHHAPKPAGGGGGSRPVQTCFK